MELFEKTRQDRINNIRRVLTTERAMRVQVFKTKPDIQMRKVAEIDKALKDLGEIESEVANNG